MEWVLSTKGIFLKDDHGKIEDFMINMSSTDLKYMEYLQNRFNLTDLEVFREMKELYCRLEEKSIGINNECKNKEEKTQSEMGKEQR